MKVEKISRFFFFFQISIIDLIFFFCSKFINENGVYNWNLLEGFVRLLKENLGIVGHQY